MFILTLIPLRWQGVAILLVEILGSTCSLKIMLTSHLLSPFFLIECEALLLIVLDGDILWVCFN